MSFSSWYPLGTAPHTVTVYNRATIKVLIYLYYEYYPTVTEWGQYPTLLDLRVWGFRV